MKPLAQNTLIQNRYLIVHLIGKGGMGEVYLAVDQRLGSAVALKRTYFAGDEMLGNAFEREARTLARMRHPVLPKVSDHFGEGDEQYLVMEHISGDDLAKRLELAQKPFPVSWVLFWADQLLDALSYLHTHEPPIIHRDIKPQNLKLTDENHIVLLDFGLSKTSTGMTNVSQSGSTGSVVGYTPHYAPMEQIRGIGTSPRSDLYSLSATLYQLMTNKIPADALSRADSMLNEMPDPITPPQELNPEIPQAVSEVILKGMEVSQEKRYTDAREMQKVLRKAFNEMQQATSAKTVAFNAMDQRAAAIEQPPAPGADMAASLHQPVSDRKEQDGKPASVNGASFPADANGKELDLEATMQMGSPPPPSAAKQADVRTEVFLAGSNSLPIPEKQSYESPAPPSNEIPPAPADDFFATMHSSSSGPASGSNAFPADAAVPFISVGDSDRDTSESDAASDSGFYGRAGAGGETFSPPTSPYPDHSVHDENAGTSGAALAAQPVAAAAPGKKSSKKGLVIAGGLAALFLFAVVVGGGVWAFMSYAPSVTEADPTPTPEATVEPSPEPTLEAVVDPGNTQDANTGNTNTNSVDDEDLTVSPTPESTPVDEPTTPLTRPTPQGAPRETPIRPAGTPRERPTPKPRKTPVVSPTVLQ
jgi:serine/threonine protein kinase